MPGMWELPEMSLPLPRSKPLLAVKHSITTTDFSVGVWRGNADEQSSSVQLSLSKAARLPLTGLTRKILDRLEILPAR